jgi:hypothetical protein
MTFSNQGFSDLTSYLVNLVLNSLVSDPSGKFRLGSLYNYLLDMIVRANSGRDPYIIAIISSDSLDEKARRGRCVSL